MADYTSGNNDQSLEADLYSDTSLDADVENIAGSGNLNIGYVIDYDNRAERRLGGTAHESDAVNASNRQYGALPGTDAYTGADTPDDVRSAPHLTATDMSAPDHGALPQESARTSTPHDRTAPADTNFPQAEAAGLQQYGQSSSSSTASSSSTNTYNNSTGIHNQTTNNYYNTTNNYGDDACHGHDHCESGSGGNVDIDIVNNVTVVVNSTVNNVSSIVNNTAITIGDIVGDTTSVIGDVVGDTTNLIGSVVGDTTTLIGGVAGDTTSLLETTLANILNTVTGVTNNAADNLTNITSDLLDTTTTLAGGTLTNLTDVLSGLTGNLLTCPADGLESILNATTSLTGGVLNTTGDVLNGVLDHTGDLLVDITNIDVLGDVTDFLGDTVQTTTGLVADLVQDVSSLDVPSAIEHVADGAGDLLSGLLGNSTADHPLNLDLGLLETPVLQGPQGDNLLDIGVAALGNGPSNTGSDNDLIDIDLIALGNQTNSATSDHDLLGIELEIAPQDSPELVGLDLDLGDSGQGLSLTLSDGLELSSTQAQLDPVLDIANSALDLLALDDTAGLPGQPVEAVASVAENAANVLDAVLPPVSAPPPGGSTPLGGALSHLFGHH